MTRPKHKICFIYFLSDSSGMQSTTHQTVTLKLAFCCFGKKGVYPENVHTFHIVPLKWLFFLTVSVFGSGFRTLAKKTNLFQCFLFNLFIPTVPYSGRMTGHVSLFLSLVIFGIRLTWTCKEKLSLYKEEVVEYFPSCCLKETTWKAFWTRVHTKSLGVNGLKRTKIVTMRL